MAAVAADWVVVPGGPDDLEAIARQCRRLVNRRALVAAGAAVVPLPGIDWLTDIAVLLRLLPEINAAFGLTAEQIERLSPERRVAAFKAVSAGGAVLIGRVVTRDVVFAVLRVAGVRLTVQQASKWVPLAGQAVSAALSYSALKLVCEQHIRDCIAVAGQLVPPTPTAVL